SVDRLAIGVVPGVAWHIMTGRLAEHEHAHPGDRHGGQGERPVHVGEAEPLGDARAHGEGLRARPAVAAGGPPRAYPPSPSSPSSASPESCLAKYASRMTFAAGAAASTPKPPSSMVTKVTTLGSGYGAQTPYQDWS